MIDDLGRRLTPGSQLLGTDEADEAASTKEQDRIVDLEPGELGRLASCLDAIARGGPHRVTIGFGDVTFMDSSGVNALLQLRRRLRRLTQ